MPLIVFRDRGQFLPTGFRRFLYPRIAPVLVARIPYRIKDGIVISHDIDNDTIENLMDEYTAWKQRLLNSLNNRWSVHFLWVM